jgi:thiamine pyrophosphokinase
MPVSFLHNAQRIICCDGAATALVEFGLEPDFIVGDLDSLSSDLHQRYSPRLHHDPDQYTNDLTKAVQFCSARQWNQITILGATGKREDHSLGNISLLADYAATACVQMITDYGVFTPLLASASFESHAGQQVSVFSLTPNTRFTFSGLRYPLTDETIVSWWQGTLNEAIGCSFHIQINGGRALVFRQHKT